MEAIRQTISRTALGLAEYITPVLKESKFRETGVITPAEFVTAGDFLVHHCPTWQWSGGESSKMRKYLPPEKQYLFSKGVPCYKRANQLFNIKEKSSEIVEENDVDGGWVATSFGNSESAAVIEANGEESVPDALEPAIDHIEVDDDEAEDLEDFIQRGMLDETDPQIVSERVIHPSKPASEHSEVSTGDGVLQTRTYDLYITYDKYYQTARFWLCGYDEKHRPLTEEQMYEDFSPDHANKTITMELHPHLSTTPMPSIHPCHQTEVMKKLMDMIESSSSNSIASTNSDSSTSMAAATAVGLGHTGSSGRQLGVHQYLVVFLKFVQTVIPTVEYDFTRNFKIS